MSSLYSVSSLSHILGFFCFFWIYCRDQVFISYFALYLYKNIFFCGYLSIYIYILLWIFSLSLYVDHVMSIIYSGLENFRPTKENKEEVIIANYLCVSFSSQEGYCSSKYRNLIKNLISFSLIMIILLLQSKLNYNDELLQFCFDLNIL